MVQFRGGSRWLAFAAVDSRESVVGSCPGCKAILAHFADSQELWSATRVGSSWVVGANFAAKRVGGRGWHHSGNKAILETIRSRPVNMWWRKPCAGREVHAKLRRSQAG